MAYLRTEQVDSVFFALSHPVRRDLLDRLSRDSMTVKALSEPFPESPAAITKHLKILERARLISRSKQGREHVLSFKPAALKESARWIQAHQKYWGAQLQSLEDHLVRSHGRKQK